MDEQKPFTDTSYLTRTSWWKPHLRRMKWNPRLSQWNSNIKPRIMKWSGYENVLVMQRWQREVKENMSASPAYHSEPLRLRWPMLRVKWPCWKTKRIGYLSDSSRIENSTEWKWQRWMTKSKEETSSYYLLTSSFPLLDAMREWCSQKF